jgi:hypothetical protein
VQFAKKVEQASRLPVSGSKRDACSTFLEELIDACVLELYFPAEAAAKDLQFITPVAVCLENPCCTVTEKGIHHFIERCSACGLGEKPARLESASPDLFAVIKQEGRV